MKNKTRKKSLNIFCSSLTKATTPKTKHDSLSNAPQSLWKLNVYTFPESLRPYHVQIVDIAQLTWKDSDFPSLNDGWTQTRHFSSSSSSSSKKCFSPFPFNEATLFQWTHRMTTRLPKFTHHQTTKKIELHYFSSTYREGRRVFAQFNLKGLMVKGLK